MILSYRKRSSSPDLEIPHNNGPCPSSSTATRYEQKTQIAGTSSQAARLAQSNPTSKTANNPIVHHRKNKSFSSFFHNIFQSGHKNVPLSPNEVHRKNQPSTDKHNSSSNTQMLLKQTSITSTYTSTGNTFYNNNAYYASSSSSSAESVNTILSTNSFSFVHPKKYKGSKNRGKRIPIDGVGDELKREGSIVPVKLKTQQAQPLPNCRRKKLSTLSRLSMKIGLKSKYNLQSCESLAAAAAANKAETGSGSTSSRTRSNKRRAPLPPSLPKGSDPASARLQSQCNNDNNPGPSTFTSFSTAFQHFNEPVQLRSVKGTSSYQKLRLPLTSSAPQVQNDMGKIPPNNLPYLPPSNFTFTPIAAPIPTPASSSRFSNQQPLQHRRCFSEGSNRNDGSSSRIYYHVRGKRRAPVPPVRLLAVSEVSNESPKPCTSRQAINRDRLVASSKPPTQAQPAHTEIVNEQLGLSIVSDDEEIVQNILNAKHEEQKTTRIRITSAGPSTTESISANANAQKTSSVSKSCNKNIVQYGINTPVISMPQEPGTSSKYLLYRHQQPDESGKNTKETPKGSKSSSRWPLTQPFYPLPIPQTHQARTNSPAYDDDEDETMSINSLLVHEKKVNEQVQSQLTKNSRDSKMPFFFKLKKNASEKSPKSQYANGVAQKQNGGTITSPSLVDLLQPPSSTIPPEDPVTVTGTPTKMTPKPWYKRSSSKEKAATTSTPTPTTNGITNKNKPSISILTKISELDRQAAKIVAEKRRSAAEQTYNETAKDLITMFNTTFTSNAQSGPSSGSKNSSILPSGSESSPQLGFGQASSSSSTGIDDRKKLAIVQPQSNPNFKQSPATKSVRPTSTPVSSSSSSRWNPQDSSNTQNDSILPTSIEDWTCPRCTLKNAHWRSFCDACHFRQGSTNVHSITSMFENITSSPKSGKRVSDIVVVAVANGNNRVSASTAIASTPTTSANDSSKKATVAQSTIIPPCENFLSQLPNEKFEKSKKFDGIKLHADDPEVEELDLEKIRQARLAFFARHKVSPSPYEADLKSASSSPASTASSNQNGILNQLNESSKDAVRNTNNLNSVTVTKEEAEDAKTLDPVIQLHQQLNPNISNSGPKTWKPFYPTRFRPILESIIESSAAKKSFNNSMNYELDRTYENWHLKLSEIEQEGDNNVKQPSTYSCIRNISSEIKDQINYFDRLKAQLRQERAIEEDYCSSESDASTVLDETGAAGGMMDPNRRRYHQKDYGYSDESSRRRISLGEQDYYSNGASASGFTSHGSFERNKDKRRASYEHDHRAYLQNSSTDRNPRRNRDDFKIAGDRHKYRALEHSTSAISKLLKKLEWAINVGDHKLAASLAHDLAILKANSTSAVEKAQSQPITIRVYVEDRFMQQGPFQVPVTASTTVKELKVKIECDWGIPVPFQKWILGRKIADNDQQSLADYEVVHDSMAFLYLVTPFDGQPQSVKGEDVKKDSAKASSSQSGLNLVNSQSSPSSRKKYSDLKVDMGQKDEGCSTKSSAKILQITAQESQHKITANKPENKSTERGSLNKSKSLESETSTPMPKNLPKTVRSKESTSTPAESQTDSAPSSKKGSLPSSDLTGITGIGIPTSSKTVTSKYIESITQTSNEPLSLQNSILKQSINGSEKDGKNLKQVKVEDSPEVISVRNTELAQNVNQISAVKPETIIGLQNQNGIQVNHAQQTPAPFAVKTQTQGKLQPEPNILAKINSESKESGKSQSNMAVKSQGAENTTSNIAKIHDQVGTERLLETKSELINKKKTTVSVSSPSKTTVDIPASGLVKNTTPIRRTEAQSSTKPIKLESKVINEQILIPIIPKDGPKPNQNPLKIPIPVVEMKNKANPSKSDPISSVKVLSSVVIMPELIIQSNLNEVQPNLKATKLSVEIGTNTTPSSSSTISPKITNGYKEPEKKPDTNIVSRGHLNEIQKPDLILTTTTVPVKVAQIPASSKSATTTTVTNASAKGWQASSAKIEATATPAINISKEEAEKPQLLHNELISRKNSDGIDVNLHVSFNGHDEIKDLKPKILELEDVASEPSSASAMTKPELPKPEKKEDNNETYRKMLQLMENEDFVRNNEELECPICFNKIAVGNGVTLRDCLHSFCRDCLAGTIQYSDEAQVKCPFRDNSYSCESFLQDREIKGLVSPLMFERHLAQAVKLAENKMANTFHCKNADCTGWCVFEDDVNVFNCPVCRKRNCLTCQAIHEKKDCLQYQRELAITAETDEGAKSSRIMLEKMIQRGEAIECPACHVVLLKKWGCDWVRCSYCKTEICWITRQKRWGENGKGDTSGGCKCGVNGVKCHPKCTYCH